MLVSGTVLILTCAAFFVYEFITYKEITKRQLTTIGQIVATNSTASLAFDNRNDATDILNALRFQGHIVAACIYDKQGKIFAQYAADSSFRNFPSTPEMGYRFQNDFLEGFEPVMQNDDRLGTLYLKSDMKNIYQRFRLYGIMAAAFIILSFIFAYLLSRRLQRSITRPILQLVSAAKRVSDEKDYSVRVHSSASEELQTLTDAFNHMLTEIQNQNEKISALNESLEERIAIRTSELQEANTNLIQQNEFVETIIDASIDLIAVFDKELNYLVVNRRVVESYKKSREEIVGRNMVELFPQLKEAPIVHYLKRALNGESIKVGRYESLVSEHYLENFFIPLKNKNGEVDRVLLIGHDITDIMKASERLMQVNAELEKSNRDLEQFAYVASHDLQEPLRKIQTFADLAQRNTGQPELLSRYLQKIISSASRMSNLIKAVLNYSRLSPAYQEFSEVDLNEVVRNIQMDLELVIQEKKAVIHTDGLPKLKASPLQMNQLFLNLFTNALKFTERQPEISISCHEVSSQKLEEFHLNGKASCYYQIVFSDNGIGFEEQYAEQAFSIFQRLHSSEKYAGTGIGLALCKKIVENHGGFITVKSKAGEGSSFHIFLPKSGENIHPRPDVIKEARSI
jgi:PAS domain S-box-containing protein